jgi:hypothetical protein
MLLFLGIAAQPEATDEQTADYNRQWGAWMGDLARDGALISSAPLQAQGSVVKKKRGHIAGAPTS